MIEASESESLEIKNGEITPGEPADGDIEIPI